MISIFLVKIFCALLIVNHTVADQCVQKNPCECNDADGFGYDLHGLEKMFVTNSTSSGNIRYIFHPCSDSTVVPPYNATNGQNDCNSGFAVCLYDATSQNFTLLANNNKDTVLKVNSDNSVHLVYTHGKRITTISLVCTNVENDYFFENVNAWEQDDQDQDQLNLLLFSKHACKQELFTVSTLSTGAVLNITFLLMVFAYLTIGIAVDYFFMGARGIEVIPNLAFWRDFPSLVRPGLSQIRAKRLQNPTENRDIYTSI